MKRDFSYRMRARGASHGPGWACRIHDPDGSWLNSLSLGDVLVYDAREDAELHANEIREAAALFALEEDDAVAARYRNRIVTVEWVECGAWVPSAFERALLDLMAFAEEEAATGNQVAIDSINRARKLLSPFAPEVLRRPWTGRVVEDAHGLQH